MNKQLTGVSSNRKRLVAIMLVIQILVQALTFHVNTAFAASTEDATALTTSAEDTESQSEDLDLQEEHVEYTGPVKYVERGISTKSITAKMSKEQKSDVDTAYRFFIYLMDKEGYTPNAIIGAMTYMMCEGGSYSDIMQGTYTYQSDWIYGGPSGQRMDKTEDNEAWIRWLNGKGFEDAQYANGNCNIGLGLTQESDVWWYSKDNKSTSNATRLVTAAMAAGVPWQDPAFQVDYIIQNKFSRDSAWDIDTNPGVNPKTSTGVSSLEWATRVACGVGMPAWDSTTIAELHPQYYASHIANVQRATELYNLYTKVDPWFYKPEADWHNPFAGPVVEDTTDAGLLIARIAMLLSANGKVYLESEHSYEAQELKREKSLQYYRMASHSIGKTVTATGDYAATADIAVSTAVLLSGVDDSFQRLYPGDQRKYMLNSPNWEHLGKVEETVLQPGDILVKLSPSDPDGVEEDTARHIMIYVGEKVAKERWKDTNWNVFDASLATAGTPNAYYPCMSYKSRDYLAEYQVFRCVTEKRDFSDAYWTRFTAECSDMFPELPIAYQPNFSF